MKICISHSSNTHPPTYTPQLELCKELTVRITSKMAFRLLLPISMRPSFRALVLSRYK